MNKPSLQTFYQPEVNSQTSSYVVPPQQTSENQYFYNHGGNGAAIVDESNELTLKTNNYPGVSLKIQSLSLRKPLYSLDVLLKQKLLEQSKPPQQKKVASTNTVVPPVVKTSLKRKIMNSQTEVEKQVQAAKPVQTIQPDIIPPPPTKPFTPHTFKDKGQIFKVRFLLNILCPSNFEQVALRIVRLLIDRKVTAQQFVDQLIIVAKLLHNYLELLTSLCSFVCVRLSHEEMIIITGGLQYQLKQLLEFQCSKNRRMLIHTMNLISHLYKADRVGYTFLCDCLLELIAYIEKDQYPDYYMIAMLRCISLLGSRMTQIPGNEQVQDIFDIIEQERRGIKQPWTFPFQSLFAYLSFITRNKKLTVYSKLMIRNVQDQRQKGWKPFLTNKMHPLTMNEISVRRMEAQVEERVLSGTPTQLSQNSKQEVPLVIKEISPKLKQIIEDSFYQGFKDQVDILSDLCQRDFQKNQVDFWAFILPLLLKEVKTSILRQEVLAKLLAQTEIIDFRAFKFCFDKYFTPEQLISYLNDREEIGIQIFGTLIFNMLLKNLDIPYLIPYVPDEIYPLLREFFFKVNNFIHKNHRLNQSEMNTLQSFFSGF